MGRGLRNQAVASALATRGVSGQVLDARRRYQAGQNVAAMRAAERTLRSELASPDLVQAGSHLELALAEVRERLAARPRSSAVFEQLVASGRLGELPLVPSEQQVELVATREAAPSEVIAETIVSRFYSEYPELLKEQPSA